MSNDFSSNEKKQRIQIITYFNHLDYYFEYYYFETFIFIFFIKINMDPNYPAEVLSDHRLHIGGFLYSKSLNRNGSIYWCCLKSRDKVCRARAVTSTNHSGNLIVEKGPAESKHSHAPNPDEVEAQKIKFRIKRVAAENPKVKPSAIIRDALAGASGRVIANLPERDNLKKGVRRERRKNAPPNPKSLDDLADVPDIYCQTFSGDNFLLYDSRAHGEIPDGRVLVFATKRNLEILAECEDWHLDGTFSVSPTIFTQLFTILGGVPKTAGKRDCEKVPLPLAYALLSSKQEVQYSAVLGALKSAADDYRIEGFEPVNIMSDFELAVINAASDTFPNAKINLCYFHLKQSAYRRIGDLGLRSHYINDPEVREYFHMVASLAYVPTEDVKHAFSIVIEEAPDVPRIDEFNKYFNETYINGVPGAGRRRRIPPRYAPCTWNIYEATLQGLATTNNASEGWHNRFAQMVERKHPDLYTLLNEFKKEQGDTEISILELRMGRRIKAAPKRKWLANHKRVKSIVEGYPGLEQVIDYVRLVSHHVDLN